MESIEKRKSTGKMVNYFLTIRNRAWLSMADTNPNRQHSKTNLIVELEEYLIQLACRAIKSALKFKKVNFLINSNFNEI